MSKEVKEEAGDVLIDLEKYKKSLRNTPG